jgi:predicted ATPase
MPRHQTLRAAIDWSWSLLEAEERTTFRRAALFAGGFTLEMLEELVDALAPGATGGRQPHALSTLDLLTQLVDKSLVVVEPRLGQNRYRMLETLREYALETFSSPEERHVEQRAHAEILLSLAERAKA